jgi:hypothetical protein
LCPFSSLSVPTPPRAAAALFLQNPAPSYKRHFACPHTDRRTFPDGRRSPAGLLSGRSTPSLRPASRPQTPRAGTAPPPLHKTRAALPPPSPAPIEHRSTRMLPRSRWQGKRRPPCGREEVRLRLGYLVRGHSVLLARCHVPGFGDALWSLSRHRFSRARPTPTRRLW